MSSPATATALSPRSALAQENPTAPHTLRAQSGAQPLLSPSRSLTQQSTSSDAASAGVPLTHVQTGVQPVLLYSKFTSSPRAPLSNEEKSDLASSESARRDPYGSSVELNSYSRLSRTFRSQAADAATLAGRRRLQQAGREQARAQREWDAQLRGMLESNHQQQGAHTHAIALMHEGIVAHARHHAKVDAQLATAAAPSNFAVVAQISAEDEQRSPMEMLSPDSSAASLNHSAGGGGSSSARGGGGGARPKDRLIKDNADSPTGPSAADGSADSVIAMRRRSARANARLKASALSRRRDFYTSNRPLNPFLHGREPANPEAAHPLRPALSQDTTLSREQALVREVMRHAQKNEERWEREQKERAEEAGIVAMDGEAGTDGAAPSLTSSADDPSLAHRSLSGIDPSIYRPSALFSPTTLDLLDNPYCCEPSPSGHPNPSEGIGRGGRGADPAQYLQKGRSHFRARQEIESIHSKVEANLLRDFSRLNRDDFVMESTNDADRALAEIASRSHAAHVAAAKAKQLAAVIGMGTADLINMHQQGDRRTITARTAPKALQLAGMDLFGAGAGRSHVELGEAARLARALPYAVRIVFRSARVRMQRAHVLYMMGCLPGVVEVLDVLFSPDLRQVYIAFTYNRFSHAGPAVARAVATSNAPGTGVECDGVAAVRVHLAALTASLPTPYLATHKARNNAATFVNNGVLVSSGEQAAEGDANGGGSNSSGPATDEAAHTEMLVLLRFLLESAHVDESSLVQMQALCAQWSRGHDLPHVREPSTLLPAHTLPHPPNHSTATHSSMHHPSSQVSAMSQDTQHMFSPRSGSGSNAAGAVSARRSKAAGSASSRPLAGSQSVRRGAGRAGVPQLQWAEGLFGHVAQQAAQQEIVAAASVAHRNGSNTSRGRSSVAAASTMTTAKGSQTARAPLGGMISPDAPNGGGAAHYSTSIHRRIALPAPDSATHTAFGPNSLARNAQAPPPVSMGQLQREAAEAHRARTILDPSGSTAGSDARPLSASVFVPRGHFFRSEGTMADLRLTMLHPSAGMPAQTTARGGSEGSSSVDAAADEERILRLQTDAMQQESGERLEAQRMHARVAPVRGPSGQHRDSTSLRALARKQQTTAESQKRAAERVTSNLKWTLTAQLEGVEA